MVPDNTEHHTGTEFSKYRIKLQKYNTEDGVQQLQNTIMNNYRIQLWKNNSGHVLGHTLANTKYNYKNTTQSPALEHSLADKKCNYLDH